MPNSSARPGLWAIEKHFGAKKEADHQRMSVMYRYNNSMSESLTQRLLGGAQEGNGTTYIDSYKERAAAEIAKFESAWQKA